MKCMNLKSYRLQIISLCGLISCSLGICLNSQGVFFAPAAQDLHVMIGTFSLQNTISYIITSFSAVFYVRILHKVNHQKLLLFGSLLTAGSFIATAFTNSITVFFILGILRGIGSGTFAAAVVTIGINSWFKEKRGFVTSIVFSTSGIIGILLPPLFTSIMEASSWRIAYIIMGIFSFLLILPALLSRFTIYPIGPQLPYGCEETVQDTETAACPGRSIFLALSAISIIYNIILGFVQHFPGYAGSIGLSSLIGSLMLSMCMFGNVISKLLSGIFSDAFGSLKATLLMISLNAAAVLVLFTMRNTFLMELSSFLYGMMYSVITVCLALLAKEFYTDQEYNRFFPVISLAGGIANSAATSLLGYVYDFSGSYYTVFVLLIILHLIGMAVLAGIAVKKNKRASRKATVTV